MPHVLSYATPEQRAPNAALVTWATGLAALPLIVGLACFFLFLATQAVGPAIVGLLTLIYGGVFLLVAAALAITYAVLARQCGWSWRNILRRLWLVILLLAAFYPVGIGCAAVVLEIAQVK
jgi:cytochrome bd-type quinol oxidase subunit 1